MITTTKDQICYLHNLNESTMIYRTTTSHLIHYQVSMLRVNKINHLLEMHYEATNDEIILCYNISSKISLREYLKKYYLTFDRLKNLILRIVETMSTCKEYLLDEKGLLLSAEHIWLEPETEDYYFAYCPVVREEMDSLTYFRTFIKNITGFTHQQDERAVKLIHQLNFLPGEESFGKQTLDDLLNDENDKMIEQYEPIMEEALLPTENSIEQVMTVHREFKLDRRISLLLMQLVLILVAVLCGFKLHSLERIQENLNLGYRIIVGAFLLCEALFLYKVVGISWNLNFLRRKGIKQESVKPASKWGINNPGMKRAHLLNEAGVKIPIYKRSFLIGKMKESVDLCLDHEDVSRLHCKIYMEGNQYYIADLNSDSGTYMNQKRLKFRECAPLYEDAAIRIASENFIFKFI